MNRFTINPKVAAGVIATIFCLVAGVAFATWTSNGTGSASARARTAQTVTVSATTGAADLYPGFDGGDLHFTLTNANPYGIEFTAMTPGVVTSSSPVACPATNLDVDAESGLSLAVGADTTSGALSIADVVTLDGAAPDGCQGVTFTVAVTLSGAQA
jgi:hypothetical protein